MWTLIQIFGGITLIVVGIAGIMLPVIPGIFLIYIGISLILHITLKNAWFVFKKKLFS